jgi:hypothetical protein
LISRIGSPRDVAAFDMQACHDDPRIFGGWGMNHHAVTGPAKNKDIVTTGSRGVRDLGRRAGPF